MLMRADAWSGLRSGLYLGGIGACFTLFIRAADKYRSMPW